MGKILLKVVVDPDKQVYRVFGLLFQLRQGLSFGTDMMLHRKRNDIILVGKMLIDRFLADSQMMRNVVHGNTPYTVTLKQIPGAAQYPLLAVLFIHRPINSGNFHVFYSFLGFYNGKIRISFQFNQRKRKIFFRKRCK